MSEGKQVKLFLVDGTSGGLLTAQITNWTGHVLKGPRRDLSRIRQRPEALRTGVYLLLGPDPDTTDGTMAYIGQTDEIAKRLSQHDADHDSPNRRGKDFFQEIVVITSKDENLTSAHVRYLEARLIAIAKAQGRAHLLNGNDATQVPLPEGDTSDMEYFIEQLRMLLPVLGVNLFRGRAAQSVAAHSGQVAPVGAAETTARAVAGKEPSTSAGNSPQFRLHLKKWHVDASAQVVDGEFTVLKGSRARASMPDPSDSRAPSTAHQHRLRQVERERLFEDGTLVIDGNAAIFTKDRVFSSPSSAAAIVCGRASSNGRVEWKTSEGLSYGEWESADSPEAIE